MRPWIRGLAKIQAGHQDLYEPGTELERAYMRSVATATRVLVLKGDRLG